VYFTCSKKLTCSQRSPPHGTNTDFQNAVACKGLLTYLYQYVLSKVVSVIFAVLEMSFWTLTTVTVVKLPWKFLTLIFAVLLPFCYAMLCLAVMRCLSVREAVTFVHSLKTNKHIFKMFSPSGSHTILIFHTKRYSNILTETPFPNGGVECTWNRQKSGFWPSIWLYRMLWTLRQPAVINTIVGRYPAIDRCLLELVLSTDGGPSSGVSQSRGKSVYGTESHAPVNTPKRREHNLIYASVNLTREYN